MVKSASETDGKRWLTSDGTRTSTKQNAGMRHARFGTAQHGVAALGQADRLLACSLQ
jgi:hypothetical protein